MSEHNSIRLLLEGALHMHGAYASASSDIDTEKDAPILKDGKGRVLLAGSGLAGQLRSLAAKIFNEKQLDDLFGTSKHASRLSVADATPMTDPCVTTRHRVVIDRARQAAAERLLFDQDVSAPGTAFPLRIELKSSPDKAQEDSQILAWLAKLLQWGAVTPGGGSRRGVGHCVLENTKLTSYDLSTDDGLADWLAGLPAQTIPIPSPKCQPHKHQLRMLSIDLDLEFDQGLLVADKEAAAATNSDLVAYTMPDAAHPGDKRYVLPGGGVRGVLRQAAETLWRARGHRVCEPAAAGGWCHDSRKNARENPGPIKLCPVCQLFGAIGWRAPLAVSDFVMTPQNQKNVREQLIDHVAVNRFTGGADEGKKFDETPLFHARLTGRLLLDDPQPWQLNVLAHLGLMALEHQLWFGHSGRKGVGQLTKLHLNRLRMLQSATDDSLPAPFNFKGTEKSWNSAELAAIWPSLAQSLESHNTLEAIP